MKTIIKHSLTLAFAASVALPALADLQAMDEADLERTSGQQGISQSMRIEFAPGTRLSYANPEADYTNPLPNGQHYWLVVDNLTGSVEIKDQRTSYISDFGPQGNAGAVVTTMAEEIEFDNLRTEGIYLGPSKAVTRDAAGAVTSGHQFIMGMEINGKLQYPAGTTMTVFAINK